MDHGNEDIPFLCSEPFFPPRVTIPLLGWLDGAILGSAALLKTHLKSVVRSLFHHFMAVIKIPILALKTHVFKKYIIAMFTHNSSL